MNDKVKSQLFKKWLWCFRKQKNVIVVVAAWMGTSGCVCVRVWHGTYFKLCVKQSCLLFRSLSWFTSMNNYTLTQFIANSHSNSHTHHFYYTNWSQWKQIELHYFLFLLFNVCQFHYHCSRRKTNWPWMNLPNKTKTRTNN